MRRMAHTHRGTSTQRWFSVINGKRYLVTDFQWKSSGSRMQVLGALCKKRSTLQHGPGRGYLKFNRWCDWWGSSLVNLRTKTMGFKFGELTVRIQTKVFPKHRIDRFGVPCVASSGATQTEKCEVTCFCKHWDHAGKRHLHPKLVPLHVCHTDC
eukprot:970042-Amphidinium_carterae.1